MHTIVNIYKINIVIMGDRQNKIDDFETDFLEDLSNLSGTLKHPEKNEEATSSIDVIDIDDMLETDETSNETELVPAENQETSVPAPTQQPQPQGNEPKSPDEIHDYVLDQCKDIIQQGKETLEQLQDTVINTCDGKAINGYATLLASLGKVLDTANAIGMERSRIKSAVEMENLKHSHKTQIKPNEGGVTKNTLNIIAGREEVMKMLEQATKQQD